METMHKVLGTVINLPVITDKLIILRTIINIVYFNV